MDDVGVTGAKLYLLSESEAKPNADFIFTGVEYGCWWLRSPGFDDRTAMSVIGADGDVYRFGDYVDEKIGVRPALKLKLSSVIFSSESKTFSVIVSVTGVNLNKTSTSLTVGNSETLTATVKPAEAPDKSITWSSSNISVATVDNDGKVTAVDAGTATITATATNGTQETTDDKTATCIVTVTKADAVPAKVTAYNRTYDGTEKPLVNVDNSTLVGGTMQYALGTKTKATQPYTTSIPTGTDVGTYYVWYMVLGDGSHNDTKSECVTVIIEPDEAGKQKRIPATMPSGGDGGSTPQITDPVTPETTKQPTNTDPAPAPTDPSSSGTTQDAFTGVSESIKTSTDGTATVTSVSNTTGKTLKLTGTVNQNGTNYPVSSFEKWAFNNVDVNSIIIDLKVSGNNTQTVTFQPRTFKGSEAKKLTLRLSSSSQVKFTSGSFSGSKIKKVVVSGLKKKEFKKVEKKLRKSGYKGKIVKK